MAHHTILRRADALAHWTRLDRLTLIDRPEPRTLRWWPLLFLIAMPVGYALLVQSVDYHRGSFWTAIVGGLLLFGPMGATTYLRVLGPRMIAGPDRPLDERERMVRTRAGHVSGIVITWLAVLGCFYIGAGQAFGLWTPRGALDWLYLGFVIEGWALILPVLVASWLQPRAPDQD